MTLTKKNLEFLEMLVNKAKQEGYAAAIEDAVKLVDKYITTGTEATLMRCQLVDQIKALLSKGAAK